MGVTGFGAIAGVALTYGWVGEFVLFFLGLGLGVHRRRWGRGNLCRFLGGLLVRGRGNPC